MTDKPKIFLTRELPPESMELLRSQSELTCNPHDRVLTKQEIIDGIQAADGLLCLLTDTIDARRIYLLSASVTVAAMLAFPAMVCNKTF